MSDDIKIWLPKHKGIFFFGNADEKSEDDCWKYLIRSHLETRQLLEASGWTVEPYTLTKGHKP